MRYPCLEAGVWQKRSFLEMLGNHHATNGVVVPDIINDKNIITTDDDMYSDNYLW